jgi:hypothetical protein
MSCDAARQFLLDTGWDAAGRRSAADFLLHAETCDDCRAALKDYDALRATFSRADEPPEPAGGWDALEKRLAHSLHRRQSPHVRAALAIAASVLFAVGGFQSGRYLTKPEIVQRTLPATVPATAIHVSFPPHDMSSDVREFREVSRAFDNQATWMLVSQSDPAVGVVANPLPLTKKLLLLRLALLRGGEAISNSDLIVVAGQQADLTLPLPAGQSLHYRIGTSVDELTRLTLGLELKTPHRKEPLAGLATTLNFKLGQPLSAGKLTTSEGEYELKVEVASTELSDKP